LGSRRRGGRADGGTFFDGFGNGSGLYRLRCGSDRRLDGLGGIGLCLNG
jgi:hypothetical protein